MKNLVYDIRHGLRTLTRHSGLTVLMLLTLALGLGLTATVFSLVDGVLLRPLGYPEPDRLVWINGKNASSDELPLSPPDVLDYRAQNRTLREMAAFQEQAFNLSGGDQPQHVHGATVSFPFFQVLGVKPLAGRLFDRQDERGQRPSVVILSEELWRHRFGARPDLVGQPIRLDGNAVTVVGVLPAGQGFPSEARIWVPMSFDTESMRVRKFHFLFSIGRLAPGVSLAQAQSELDTVGARLAKTYPENEGWSVRLAGLKDHITGDSRNTLVLLLAAVALVALIACGNVANLLLVKAVSREKEMAIHTALGAGRGRLVRRLLTEGLILGLAGGALAMLLAQLGLLFVQRLSPGDLPRLDEVAINARVLGFVLLISLLSTAIFALAPSLFATRINTQRSLKQGGKGSGGLSERWLGRLLIVGEVTLSLVLLVLMGLLVGTFLRLLAVDPGFKSRGVTTAKIVLTSPRWSSPNRPAPFFEEMIAALSARPGVEAVGAVNALPFSGQGGDLPFTIEGRPVNSPREQPWGLYRVASPGYFEAMSIPLLRGRSFTPQDRLDAPRVVIVDQNMAEGYWPGQNPIGQRIRIEVGEPFVAEVVGVVGNVRQVSLRDEPIQTLYMPYLQDQWQDMTIVVRGRGELGPVIREEAVRIDREQPVILASLDSILARALARPRFNMLLLCTFAGLGLLLAMIGLYGVVSFSVSQRSRELGIRIALGAQKTDNMSLVLREGLRLALVGLGLGLVGAVLASRTVTSQLFGVQPTDPMTYFTAALLLLLVALLACFVPARRAARVSSVTVMQSEP